LQLHHITLHLVHQTDNHCSPA